MTSNSDLDALTHWLVENRGQLNSSVQITYSAESGVHCRTRADVPAGAIICTVPHTLALSSLNALVDDSFTAFRARGLPAEAIGHFYLMHQWLLGEKSFWRPYLRTLPSPSRKHSTPFWFDEHDLAWLAETDVYHTTTARQAIQRRNYEHGLQLLREAHVDTAQYTWTLFTWAVTMFTSRSFSSRALWPQDGKYWTAYKQGPDGRRQTALMDMSHTAAEDLDFPVLFPVVDIPNHHHSAQIDWQFDPGQFSISPAVLVPAGTELYNNYGPKGNDELLLGYGFCLADNPFDKVLLTLKSPSEDLQKDMVTVHPGYFDSNGAWSSEKTTFGLTQMSSNGNLSIFEQLPEPLIELLLYILRSQRGLPFRFVQKPLEHVLAAGSIGNRYQSHLARIIVESLAPKLLRLKSTTPSDPPTNYRQKQAGIYRSGQMKVLESVISGCKAFLRTNFRPSATITPGFDCGRLLTLTELLSVASSTGRESHVEQFIEGIASSAGTDNVEQLRAAGWEEDVFVLLLCYLHLDGWKESLEAEYLNIEDQTSQNTGVDDLEQARGLMAIVRHAAQSIPGSLWQDARWSDSLIADYGGAIMKHESFLMMLPSPTSVDASAESATLVVYLHLGLN